jgi:hypothetical protein
MLKGRLLLICVFWNFSMSNAWGTDIENRKSPTVEIWTGSLASFSAATMAGVDVYGFNALGTGLGNGSIVSLPSPSLGYILSPHFELVLSANFNSSIQQTKPVSTQSTVFQVSGGLVYSLSDDFEHAYFLRAEAGAIVLNYNNKSQPYFLGSAQVGKRFKLAENISYSPVIAFEMITTMPADTLSLSLVPLQFSFWL